MDKKSSLKGKKTLNLRKAIDEGIKSGISKHFDPEKHLQELKTQRNK